MDLERCRKDAKRLLRSYQAGDEAAVRRAQAVLGKRAERRFKLSDALHVLAVEAGFRSWPELARASPQTDREPDAGTAGRELPTELQYLPGRPVILHVRVRRFPYVDDGGAAAGLAGVHPVPNAILTVVAREHDVNVNRAGVVSLPVVPAGIGFESCAHRVAEASVALFEALLEATA